MRHEELMVLETIAAVLSFANLLPGVNIKARIRSWWVIVAILGGTVILGRSAVLMLFAVISFIALREFLALTDTAAADRRGVITIFAVVLPARYLLVAFHRSGWINDFLPALGLPLILVLTANGRNDLARTSRLIAAVLICIYGISFVPALPDSGSRGLLMVFLLLVTQASDVLQYIWGKLAGKHKLAAKISPSKTVEGFIGGVVSATALGAGLYWMTPFTVVQAAGMALIIALAGVCGGLVLSAIKREHGVKDWSQLIPGHGGMLDRVDSLCFSAPLFCHLLRMYFPGSA
jgi:phosphatidate cytidylyltransferase